MVISIEQAVVFLQEFAETISPMPGARAALANALADHGVTPELVVAAADART
jgi:hypothetical protein